MARSQLPLADDLYLAAHDSPRGRCLLTATTLGLGLAAALLGELVMWGRLDVREDQLEVLDERPTTDPPTSAVLEQLLRESHHRQVRDWISFLSTGVATELVERRLARAGLVRRVEKRGLLGTRVRFVPTDTSLTDWTGTRIRVAATRGELLDTSDLVLTGLMLATGLDQHALATLEARERDHLYDQLRRRMPATLQQLVGHAEAAVGDAVMARRA